MIKTLYILRGLPGAGKTTLAKELSETLGIPYVEADQWFYDENGVYTFNTAELPNAHIVCRASVHINMTKGLSCIVSNTSTTEKELQPYLEMAERYGYKVVSLIVENRHGNASVHNVPEQTIQKMKDRFEVKL